MADVNVKMGVSGISQFKQGMSDASSSVKTFDAALKANEKQLKATGNAENYMQAQTTLLNGKLEAQRNIVKNAEQALKQMEANGVKTTSKAYQDMQRRMIEAQSGMMDTEQALNNLGNTATDAAGKTDKLQDSLGGLNKKVSLDQVISGIDSITGAMEKAAKKAVEVGKLIWENITDAARWSDDINTQAAMLGMDVEDYQAYKDVFDTFADLTVQEWMKAKTKVQKAMLDPTGDQLDALTALGLAPRYGGKGSLTVEQVAGDWEDMLWDIGQALRDKVASGEMSMDLADVYANAIFGKSFASLNPLFNMGKEAFYEAVQTQTVASKEAIEANAELNDKLILLQGDFQQLKAELTAGLAPALSKAADAISGLLGKIMEYLESPEGQQAMKDLETAVTGLFDDLGKIDPEDVVSGFTSVFNKVVESVKWLVENKDSIVSGLEAIFGIWATLKVSSGVTTILKVIDGLKWLKGGGGAGAGATGGTNAAAVAGGATMAEWATFGLVDMAPVWLLAEAIRNETQGQAEDQRKAGLRRADYIETAGKVLETGDESLMAAINAILSIGDTNQSVNVDAFKGLAQLWADWNDWSKNDESNPVWEALTEALSDETYDRFGELMDNVLTGAALDQRDTTELIEQVMKEIGEYADANKPDIPVEMTVPSDEAERLSKLIGTVLINGEVVMNGEDGEHANGIWSIPFDGYHAVLHKGERVVPAREVGSSRNFSSNLYVESMYMNNGTDAEGLAAAIAAANRRTMRGYGS